MPNRRKTVQTPQGPAETTVVDVVAQQENFNVYTLEDGTVLRSKLVVVEVVRVDGQWDAEGNPAYFMRSQQVVTAESPEHMKRGRGTS